MQGGWRWKGKGGGEGRRVGGEGGRGGEWKMKIARKKSTKIIPRSVRTKHRYAGDSDMGYFHEGVGKVLAAPVTELCLHRL